MTTQRNTKFSTKLGPAWDYEQSVFERVVKREIMMTDQVINARLAAKRVADRVRACQKQNANGKSWCKVCGRNRTQCGGGNERPRSPGQLIYDANKYREEFLPEQRKRMARRYREGYTRPAVSLDPADLSAAVETLVRAR